MRNAERGEWQQQFLFVAYVVAAMAAFYLYVALRIRPELFYQQKPDIFLCDWRFFFEYLGHPGGLVEYVSDFLSPLFALGWLGAIVTTFLTTLICLSTRQFIAAIAGRGGGLVFLVPAVLILVVLGQYIHPVKLCVGLLCVLVHGNVYVWFRSRPRTVRLIVFVVLSASAYYLAAGLYVVFALMCGIFEWGFVRSRRLGVVCILCAVAVPPVVSAWLLIDAMDVETSFRALIPPSSEYWLAMPSSGWRAQGSLMLLFVFFPVAAIILIWRGHRSGTPARRESTANGMTPAAEPVDLPEHRISVGRLALQLTILAALAVGADLAAFDFPTRCLLQIAHSTEQHKWDDVLRHAQRLPASDVFASDVKVGACINRALYHRGSLLDCMFGYIQASGAPALAVLFDKITTMAQTAPMECSEILFDLGRINESEHMAFEALETLGDRPSILKRLVYINILKDEPDAACRFLALLERSLLHSRWAQRCLQQLRADPTLSDVPEVSSRRDLMVVHDAIGPFDEESLLRQLLDRNKQNRMAFEYLMAHYLLTRQLDKIVANLPRLDEFDFPHLPRHLEEAVVIYLETTGVREPDLGGRPISVQTQRRYREFLQAFDRYRDNPAVAFVVLFRDFGDSYFFFHAFGHNDLAFVLSGRSK